MSPLLVIALIIASILVVFFAGEGPFVTRASKVGGFAFILYGIVLGLIYLMSLAKA